MPKKKWTPEERAAFAQKMKAARQAKNQAVDIAENPPTVDSEDVAAILKRLAEVEQELKLARNEPQPVVKKAVVTKYSFNPKDYPDPRDRLFEEPKLKLKNFTRDWFDLGWNVAKIQYDDEGQKTLAPRFELELYKIIEDPETGEPSDRRWTVCKGMFFEDPDSFLTLASEQGLDIPEDLTKDFLDEMRYCTMRDWVLEAFYPPRINQKKAGRSEEVIGNRLVEVFTVSSTTAVDTAELKSKLG